MSLALRSLVPRPTSLFVASLRITRTSTPTRPPVHVSPASPFPSSIYLQTRKYALTPQEIENTNVSHSRFLAEASHKDKWNDGESDAGAGGLDSEHVDTLAERKGKLSPTASHIFKLILPLEHYRRRDQAQAADPKSPPPTVFLLHPSQPLSHVSRLILASLAPETPTISFRSITPRGHTIQWSESTDVANFIRDAARTREFKICITAPGEDEPHAEIPVEVPSFEDRTRFLRRRLAIVQQELTRMEELKKQCDEEAHRGARRMAVGGFGILVVYWGVVARLTFWDLGWDVMEPITYLSGLSMVILGYMWFLVRGREVSYSSVLHHSVSARREALYKARGLNVDRWLELVNEARSLRREISRIAEDYDERRWKESEEEEREARERGASAQAGDAKEAEEENFVLIRNEKS